MNNEVKKYRVSDLLNAKEISIKNRLDNQEEYKITHVWKYGQASVSEHYLNITGGILGDTSINIFGDNEVMAIFINIAQNKKIKMIFSENAKIVIKNYEVKIITPGRKIEKVPGVKELVSIYS